MLDTRMLTIGLFAVSLVVGGCGSDAADQEESPTAVATSTEADTATPTETAASSAPTAAETTASDATATFDADQQAVATVFSAAFDPEGDAATAYASHPELENVLDAAEAAAEAQGGTTIGAEVNDVVIEGDVANVMYAILLGGSPVADGSGYAVREDGEWKVHITTLCGLLQLSGAPEACERVEPPLFTGAG